MVRTFQQDIIERFASNSRVPVINGLTDEYPPCQILATSIPTSSTVAPIKGRTVAWIGDSNNVCNTWIEAAEISASASHLDAAGLRGRGERLNKSCATFSDPMAAAKAPISYHRCLTSMGFEAENEERKRASRSGRSTPNDARGQERRGVHALLPAHRGEEVCRRGDDGPASVVWEEAENRLHTQKALLELLVLGKVKP